MRRLPDSHRARLPGVVFGVVSSIRISRNRGIHQSEYLYWLPIQKMLGQQPKTSPLSCLEVLHSHKDHLICQLREDFAREERLDFYCSRPASSGHPCLSRHYRQIV